MNETVWNWQQPEWPVFSHDAGQLDQLEFEFSHQAGVCIGLAKGLTSGTRQELYIQMIGDEAVETSAIEGDVLHRDSVQLSLKREFGMVDRYQHVLNVDPNARETGIARLMKSLHEDFQAPLSKEHLCDWHTMLMAGNPHIDVIGDYRTHTDDMTVVTINHAGRKKLHFVAPRSADVPQEMARFITWFNNSSPTGRNPLPTLTRAGIIHLYFISIHPFEDGNGRMGRALAEKAIYQNSGVAMPLSLSTVINHKRNRYYDQIATNNRSAEITGWLRYFAETAISAKKLSVQQAELVIDKHKFFRAYRSLLNNRQKRLLAKLFDNTSRKRFQQGIKEYKGAFNAQFYMGVTNVSSSTATRDLKDLVNNGILVRSGERKGAKYYFPLEKLVAELDRHDKPDQNEWSD